MTWLTDKNCIYCQRSTAARKLYT